MKHSTTVLVVLISLSTVWLKHSAYYKPICKGICVTGNGLHDFTIERLFSNNWTVKKCGQVCEKRHCGTFSLDNKRQLCQLYKGNCCTHPSLKLSKNQTKRKFIVFDVGYKEVLI